mmetsp:Transcript_50799/g.149786  ORF Transcript_50799/g.149786 Transcript_50799/m.149786 type:complete len:263 (+) Transcript_50799:362-1150(+)
MRRAVTCRPTGSSCRSCGAPSTITTRRAMRSGCRAAKASICPCARACCSRHRVRAVGTSGTLSTPCGRTRPSPQPSKRAASSFLSNGTMAALSRSTCTVCRSGRAWRSGTSSSTSSRPTRSRASGPSRSCAPGAASHPCSSCWARCSETRRTSARSSCSTATNRWPTSCCVTNSTRGSRRTRSGSRSCMSSASAPPTHRPRGGSRPRLTRPSPVGSTSPKSKSIASRRRRTRCSSSAGCRQCTRRCAGLAIRSCCETARCWS